MSEGGGQEEGEAHQSMFISHLGPAGIGMPGIGMWCPSCSPATRMCMLWSMSCEGGGR
jgi:hypothetical protein